MVVVEKLSKFPHLILLQSTYKIVQISNIFMTKIFRLNGIPKTITLDRDLKFSSALWKDLFDGLGTQVQFSTEYLPQTYGKTERANEILEDVLCMYIMNQPTNVRIIYI